MALGLRNEGLAFFLRGFQAAMARAFVPLVKPPVSVRWRAGVKNLHPGHVQVPKKKGLIAGLKGNEWV